MSLRLAAGTGAAAVVLLPCGGALLALLGAGDGALAALAEPRLLRIAGFTLGQAALSTLLAVGLALPVARALARRTAFPGRAALLALFGLPLVMPTIVAVFGLIEVYGRQGWVARLLDAAGRPGFGFPYGLAGILLGHVFFNLPLAVRLLLPQWQAVPGEVWRLAAQLGMGPGAVWRLIEWPLLARALPGVALLVFVLCCTSFAVVLALGGGPAAATLEVAIYQALRFDFEPARAAALALAQLVLCLGLAAFAARAGRPLALGGGELRAYPRPDVAGRLAAALDGACIAAAALFVGLPVAALAVAALRVPAELLADARLWRAAGLSLALALGAGLAALLLGWSLLLAARDLRLRRGHPRAAAAFEGIGLAGLATPPLVLGTGLFVWLAPHVDVFVVAPALLPLLGALLGLPYVLRVLGPPCERVAAHYDRLCANLGVTGWQRARLVEWPLLRRAVAQALALACALAAGDLGAVALFGSPATTTLPLLLYQQLGAYRMDAAALSAALLLALCLALYHGIERALGGGDAR